MPSTSDLPTDIYGRQFFVGREARAAASADVVVPLLLSLFPVASVVDVGCANGLWLEAFARLGIADYLGLDGDYVPRDLLRIPADRFRVTDLKQPPRLERRFDLACSLEVAEHLPADSADTFVDFLVSAAPVVAFSAAVPRQGGDGHVNEQWQSYWQARFARRGYLCIDCLRPALYGNTAVNWWYRQNMLVYCERGRVPAGYTPLTHAYEVDRVDPAMVEHVAAGPEGVKGRAKVLFRDIGLLGAAVATRIGRRPTGR